MRSGYRDGGRDAGPEHRTVGREARSLIAAIELISPRNKDRPSSRETYLTRYLGYLLESVHLLLVDVHRRPIGFSFADRIRRSCRSIKSRFRRRWP